MTTRLAVRFHCCRVLLGCTLLRCTLEYPLEERRENAAPVSLSEACLELGRSLSDDAAAQGPASDAPLGRSDRLDAYVRYCQPTQAATGWEHCAQPGAGRSAPDCSGPVLAYLVCLTHAAPGPTSECAPLAATCAPETEVVTPVFNPAQACELGRGFDGRNSTLFAYTLLASNCSDGNSYSFTCEPPDPGCSSSCACASNAALSSRVQVDVSTEVSDQVIWDACGLPVLVPSSR